MLSSSPSCAISKISNAYQVMHPSCVHMFGCKIVVGICIYSQTEQPLNILLKRFFKY